MSLARVHVVFNNQFVRQITPELRGEQQNHCLTPCCNLNCLIFYIYSGSCILSSTCLNRSCPNYLFSSAKPKQALDVTMAQTQNPTGYPSKKTQKQNKNYKRRNAIKIMTANHEKNILINSIFKIINKTI